MPDLRPAEQEAGTRHRASSTPSLAEGGSRRSRVRLALVALVTLLLGGWIGRLLPPWVVDDSFIWRFLLSPGLGGLAAFAAAVLGSGTAVWLGRRERRARLRKERKDQWWERARWALDLTVDSDRNKRTVGYRVLRELAISEWADEHEQDIIDAATEDATGSQLETEVPEDQLAYTLRASTGRWIRGKMRNATRRDD